MMPFLEVRKGGMNASRSLRESLLSSTKALAASLVLKKTEALEYPIFFISKISFTSSSQMTLPTKVGCSEDFGLEIR